MSLSSSQLRIHTAALRLFAEKGSSNITVRELAEAAGVARGTIYNHNLNPETLFEDIASQLSQEMNARISNSFDAKADFALRLAHGIRMYIRRAHEEPDWGRFLCQFAFSSQSLMTLWTGTDSPLPDVMSGLQQNRYDFRPEQMMSVMSVIAGSVLTAIYLVLQGYRTWRDAGSDTAELVLKALGVSAGEARQLAQSELPVLASI